MLSGFGVGALNMLTGIGQVGYSYRVHDFRDDEDLLKQWGKVCRREFRWEPTWGDVHMVVSAKHPTPEAANEQAARMAIESGYTAPRWWQFWRWKEPHSPPSKIVRHEDD